MVRFNIKLSGNSRSSFFKPCHATCKTSSLCCAPQSHRLVVKHKASVLVKQNKLKTKSKKQESKLMQKVKVFLSFFVVAESKYVFVFFGLN
jgi:hypothetical protein